MAGRVVAAGIEEAMKTMTQAPPEVRRGHPRRHLVMSRFEPVAAEFVVQQAEIRNVAGWVLWHRREPFQKVVQAVTKPWTVSCGQVVRWQRR